MSSTVRMMELFIIIQESVFKVQTYIYIRHCSLGQWEVCVCVCGLCVQCTTSFPPPGG